MNTIIPAAVSGMHERKLALLEMRMNAPANLSNQTSPPKEIGFGRSTSPFDEYQDDNAFQSHGLPLISEDADQKADEINNSMEEDVADEAIPDNNLNMVPENISEEVTRKRSYESNIVNENSHDGGSHLSESGRQGKFSRASEDNSNAEPITTNYGRGY
jgi:hypothetical protein